jgi:hypothetical protein
MRLKFFFKVVNNWNIALKINNYCQKIYEYKMSNLYKIIKKDSDKKWSSP